MSDKSMENERNQLRMTCIDFAVRAAGKPVYLQEKSGQFKKYQYDIIELADKIYKFVIS
jgi:hypothetical protein